MPVATGVPVGFSRLMQAMLFKFRTSHENYLAQDVAEGVLGAAEDGGVKVLIFSIEIFQRQNPSSTHACRPPRLPLGDT